MAFLFYDGQVSVLGPTVCFDDPEIVQVQPFYHPGGSGSITIPTASEGNLLVIVVGSTVTFITNKFFSFPVGTEVFGISGSTKWIPLQVRVDQGPSLFNRHFNGSFAAKVPFGGLSSITMVNNGGSAFATAGFVVEIKNWFGVFSDGVVSDSGEDSVFQDPASSIPTQGLTPFNLVNNGLNIEVSGGDFPSSLPPSNTVLIQFAVSDSATEEPANILQYPSGYPVFNRSTSVLNPERIQAFMAAQTGEALTIPSDSFNLDKTVGWRSSWVAIRGCKVLSDDAFDTIGTTGNDTITGTTGDDIINAGPGNDSVTGDLGDDTLFGDTGSDTIEGGGGADIIDGGQGSDSLSGGDGSDTIRGGSESDTIEGGAGDDSLSGGSGQDTISGGSGDDTLLGGDGDNLTGGTGANKFIVGGTCNSIDVITDFVVSTDGSTPLDTIQIIDIPNITQGSGFLTIFEEGGGGVEIQPGLNLVCPNGTGTWGVANSLSTTDVETLFRDLGDGSILDFGLFFGPALVFVTDGTDSAIFRVDNQNGTDKIDAADLCKAITLESITDCPHEDQFLNFSTGLQGTVVDTEIAEHGTFFELGGFTNVSIGLNETYMELGGSTLTSIGILDVFHELGGTNDPTVSSSKLVAQLGGGENPEVASMNLYAEFISATWILIDGNWDDEGVWDDAAIWYDYNWLLRNGIWRDTGNWVDTANWDDN